MRKAASLADPNAAKSDKMSRTRLEYRPYVSLSLIFNERADISLSMRVPKNSKIWFNGFSEVLCVSIE